MASTISVGKKPPASEAIPSELIFEILTWLPGKPVARFKCVCKDWLSMIRSGQFRKAYRSRQRCLILYWCEEIARERGNNLDPDRRLRFYYSSLRRLNEPPPADFSPLLELELISYYDGVSRVINGLVCREDFKNNGVKLTLHNIFTGEKMKVPDPVKIFARLGYSFSTYHLGYALMAGEYKILRLVFHLDRFTRKVVNLPLLAQTIVLRPSGSDSAWKTLNYQDSGLGDLDVRSKTFYKMVSHHEARTYCFDGNICWFRPKNGLILFDFQFEKFHWVKFPEDLQHEKRAFVRTVFNGYCNIALYVLPQDGKPECFLWDDYAVDRDDMWRKEDVEFPEDILGIMGGAAVADGDEILLLMENQENGSRIVYSYGDDKLVERFRVGNLPNNVKPLDLNAKGPVCSIDQSMMCLLILHDEPEFECYCGCYCANLGMNRRRMRMWMICYCGNELEGIKDVDDEDAEDSIFCVDSPAAFSIDVEILANSRGIKGGLVIADGDEILLLMENQELLGCVQVCDDTSVEWFIVGNLPNKVNS